MSANVPVVRLEANFSNREKSTVTKNVRSKRNVNRKARRTKGSTQNQPTAMETDEQDEAMANQENTNLNIQTVGNDDDDQETESDRSEIIGGDVEMDLECAENSDECQEHLSQKVQEMEIDCDGAEEEVNMDEDDTTDEDPKDTEPNAKKAKPARKQRRAYRSRAIKKKKAVENESNKEEMDEDEDEDEDENDNNHDEEEQEEEDDEETKPAKTKKSRASRNVAKSKARAPKKRKANRVQVAAVSDDDEEDENDHDDIDEDDKHNKRRKTNRNKNKKEKKPKARKDRALELMDHFKPKREQRFVCGKTVMIELKRGSEPTRGWVHEMTKDKVCIRYYVVDSKTKREKTKEKWVAKNSQKIYPFNRAKRD